MLITIFYLFTYVTTPSFIHHKEFMSAQTQSLKNVYSGLSTRFYTPTQMMYATSNLT